MQTFKYRLQQLLDLKIDHRSQLQLSVARCEKELAVEKEELAALRRSESELQEKLFASRRMFLAGRDGASGLTIQQHRDYLSGLTLDLETARNSTFSQQLRVHEFEEKLAQARRNLTECLREIDVLTKHREKLHKRFLRALEMKDTAEQDEIGATMFLRGPQSAGRGAKQEGNTTSSPTCQSSSSSPGGPLL